MNQYPKQHIFERDNFTCKYCGWFGAEDFEQWNRGWLAIDHVKPRKHGGSDSDENLVVACHSCNSMKGCEDCESVEDGKQIIARKIEERKVWFERHVWKSHEASS